MDFPIETSELVDFYTEQNLSPKLIEFVSKEAEHALRCGPCACGEQKRAEHVKIDSMRMWRERFRLPILKEGEDRRWVGENDIEGWEEDPSKSFICTVSQTTCQLCQHKQKQSFKITVSNELEKVLNDPDSTQRG